ncbi:EAL and HDOD domain-containing protein [Amphritea balenae]|uniref:HDOD domain-containing protein n=1 Tax=Amphritea balenae TaxID=452629 RepID=A0A3P1SPL6_9GAMM|nr:HDOD domain-containing protein [Amphritea balenae]RRC99000.1 HDOD domain-containing protein [Amphritea balenae]GGK63575.1 histidine kinase [Amphritea balenae]
MNSALEDDLLADSSVLLARQPVFNKNQDVEAYGLLYRSDDGSLPAEFSDEQATASVILNSYAMVSDTAESKRLPLYVKLTESMLLSDMLPTLPKESVIFELLREDGISKDLIKTVRERKQQGYRFALTHYNGDKSQTALLDVVHVVKIDIQRHTEDELKHMVNFCKPYHVDLLADKVETQDDFRRCIELGFNLFQGFFLCRPVEVKGKKLGSSKALIFELLAELENPNANAASVEQIVINDPVMAYKILKLVNSAAFSTPKQIESISHAISLIGMEQVKKWATLFMLSGQSGKPVELTRMMLIRGRMCELLAEMLSYESPMNFFMVGLLSQLDAMMDMEMTELLQQVPLNDEIKEAILSQKNKMGHILSEVSLYERAEWDEMEGLLEKPYYEVAYRHSMVWAQQVLESLQD